MEEMEETEEKVSTDSYRKRPLWQWIVIYLFVGALIYGLVYYFIFARKGGYVSSPQGTYQLQQQAASPTVAQTNAGTTSNIYMTKTDAVKGVYLTDFQGMTLYVFDKDTQGVSNCAGTCATIWPPYSSGATAQSQLPVNITVITRADGSKQFAWKGMPLYYYAKDTKAGDTTGDGIGGVWHLIKP
jgi:predicted lipoprotein with Yx(FWY)xxD motif